MRLLEIRWANSIIQLASGASELSRAILIISDRAGAAGQGTDPGIAE